LPIPEGAVPLHAICTEEPITVSPEDGSVTVTEGVLVSMLNTLLDSR